MNNKKISIVVLCALISLGNSIYSINLHKQLLDKKSVIAVMELREQVSKTEIKLLSADIKKVKEINQDKQKTIDKLLTQNKELNKQLSELYVKLQWNP